MHAWLEEKFIRWRSERPTREPVLGSAFLSLYRWGSAGFRAAPRSELLSLAPWQLRDLIRTEMEQIYDREIASVSRATAGWCFTGTGIACAAFVTRFTLVRAPDISIVDLLWFFIPVLALFAALWIALTWIVTADSRILARILKELPGFSDPAYACALMPLLS